ncbi:MAG: hypothetical protein ABEJ72_04920 [Candidatus Aenigmatarchaeota archaeon]
MVIFKEDDLPSKQDHFFVKEDPARIYRGLKDLLVDEFDIDRIEEGHMEFRLHKPKDRIRLHAFKEKSPHTVLYFNLSFKAKAPKSIYKMERPEGILKARVQVTPKVITVYPGGDPIAWLPQGIKETENTINKPGLEAEHVSDFQKSKFYEILTGIWYHKFYHKEIHRYKEEAEETAVHIHNMMREKFGVEKSIHRSGASHYNPPWK